MYFKRCERCGAYLDPGEPCDCGAGQEEDKDSSGNAKKEDMNYVTGTEH